MNDYFISSRLLVDEILILLNALFTILFAESDIMSVQKVCFTFIYTIRKIISVGKTEKVLVIFCQICRHLPNTQNNAQILKTGKTHVKNKNTEN